MTTAALDRPRIDAVQWWRDHGWPPIPLPLVIGVLLVAVLAAAGARIDYAATYQPLQFGGSFGPVTPDSLDAVSDGFDTTRWLVVGAPGAIATLEYGLRNTGSDPVTVYDVPSDPYDPVKLSMGWATLRDPTPRALPVVIPPHGSVELLLSIRNPVCQPNGGHYSLDHLVVHYRAFGFSHTLDQPLYGFGMAPIEICAHRH
ncbi:MAG: hypothetical protein QOC82_995 [Frankiaceae bacterium]|nr:hypothetical protein [Frankiaceae bacterium]